MTRRVRLRGHEFDLDDLADSFNQGDPRVVKDGAEYFLVAAEFADFGDAHVALLNRAQEILTQMNGAARLLHSKHRSVGVDGSIHDPDRRIHQVVRAQTATARGRVSLTTFKVDHEGGATSAPETFDSQTALTWSTTNASVAAVLRLMAVDDLGWVNLYRILDYVVHECNGKSGLISAGLATKADIDRFGASANRPEVSGDSARHGPTKGPPPTRTMSIAEGTEFIRRLVLEWLRTL